MFPEETVVCFVAKVFELVLEGFPFHRDELFGKEQKRGRMEGLFFFFEMDDGRAYVGCWREGFFGKRGDEGWGEIAVCFNRKETL